MRAVEIRAGSTERIATIHGGAARRELDAALARVAAALGNRRVIHLNSTATGGGVAEMLASLTGYAAGAGIDVGWLVLDGGDEFFEVTKRIHNRLHESDGDGDLLDDAARSVYDRAIAAAADELLGALRPDDVVVAHDPQTAGLVPVLRDRGHPVIWRCHVGVDEPGRLARSAWAFLCDDVVTADVLVFSRDAFVWEGLPPDRVVVVPPCIDPLSSKNQPLDPSTVAAILDSTGVVPASGHDGPGVYTRSDETRAKVTMSADMIESAPVPPDAPVVTQVSRWDALKDPVGVIEGFCRARLGERHGAHLVLAGPAVEAVADDPEGRDILEEVRRTWESCPPRDRRNVHIACLPMDDVEENGVVVNALQRRAAVVVQKSVAEGFGLTIAEAMWKERPVVAPAVGGIKDQIVDGVSGVLLDDGCDLDAFGAAVGELLDDRDRSAAMGVAAAARVRERFLPVHHFRAEVDLIERALG